MDTAIAPTQQIPPMAILARKMANIMGQLKRLRQNGQNTQGWTFTSIDDITDAIRALMAEHGIALFSRMLNASVMKEGKVTSATVNMEFELVCADSGVSKVMTWTGSADDFSDKAVNKAAVYAEKFWLKSTFLVSTGKDPDATSPRIDGRDTKQQKTPVQQPRPERVVDMQTGEVLSAEPTPEPVQHWHLETGVLLKLAARSHGAGFIGHDGDAGIDDMLALIQPKRWSDYGSLNEAALAVKAAAQAKTPPALEPTTTPKRCRREVSEATFDADTETVTFDVPEGALKIKRSSLLGLLDSGDAKERINGKRQAEAMELDRWITAGSPFPSTHSFPALILHFDVMGSNGTARLSLVSVESVKDWRGEPAAVKSPEPAITDPEALKLVNGSASANDDIPTTVTNPHYHPHAAMLPGTPPIRGS